MKERQKSGSLTNAAPLRSPTTTTTTTCSYFENVSVCHLHVCYQLVQLPSCLLSVGHFSSAPPSREQGKAREQTFELTGSENKRKKKANTLYRQAGMPVKKKSSLIRSLCQSDGPTDRLAA